MKYTNTLTQQVCPNLVVNTLPQRVLKTSQKTSFTATKQTQTANSKVKKKKNKNLEMKISHTHIFHEQKRKCQ